MFFQSFLVYFGLVQICSGSFAVVRKDQQGQFVIDPTKFDNNGVAWGRFEDGLNVTGWGILDIETNGNYDDDDQAFAAGMLEGYLTAQHIYTASKNLALSIFKIDEMPIGVQDFMNEQDKWAREMVTKNKKSDPFFQHVGFILQQFDGLIEGYHQNDKVQKLDLWRFQMLNGVGDLFDIMPSVNTTFRADWDSMTKQEAINFHAKAGHCSALVKLTGNFSDMFFGHSSWYTFSNTDRIFKHFTFNYNNPSTAAKTLSYSSYPGFLESLDDFYMLGSGIGWTQTTNPIIDHSVYVDVKPQSLLAWQRVRVASAMSKTGKEWFKNFKREYSGTYANQYVVVDFKLFTPNKAPLEEGTLWVVEEMPGLIIGKDMTSYLALGYWPSYNVPFYPEIYKKSGYIKMAQKHGNEFTYDLAPRGQIFRRDQTNVVDLPSFKKVMRSNNFHNDPYAFDGIAQNPLYAICARGDLSTDRAKGDFGCYDTKVTSYLHGILDRKAEIINGPTTAGGTLEPFEWKEWHTYPHYGLPTKYDFSFIHTEPYKFKFESSTTL